MRSGYSININGAKTNTHRINQTHHQTNRLSILYMSFVPWISWTIFPQPICPHSYTILQSFSSSHGNFIVIVCQCLRKLVNSVPIFVPTSHTQINPLRIFLQVSEFTSIIFAKYQLVIFELVNLNLSKSLSSMKKLKLFFYCFEGMLNKCRILSYLIFVLLK